MFAVYIPRLIRSLLGYDRKENQTVIPVEYDEFGDPIGMEEQVQFDPLLFRRFQSAADHLAKHGENLDKHHILEFYGLYKQAVFGPAKPADQPSLFDLKNRMKFDAWLKIGDMDRTLAMVTYCSKMDYLGLGWEFKDTDPEPSQGFGQRPSRPAAENSESSDADNLPQDKETALFFAASKANEIATVTRIIRSRPELVGERDQHLGMTALQWAIDAGADEVVVFLIENGAQVNAVDPEGNTPLHFAATCHRMQAAQLLLAKGADPTLKNSEGMIPADNCPDEPTLQQLLTPKN